MKTGKDERVENLPSMNHIKLGTIPKFRALFEISYWHISIMQNLLMEPISHSKANDPIYNMCVDSRPSLWPISPRSFIWHISPLISSLNLDQGIETHSWCTNTRYGTLSWPLSRKNSALLGTLPRLELCLGWNFVVHGTLPRLELYLGWNFA